MTMKELKKVIVESFRKQYGFAPAMKAIRPMETSGEGELIYAMAFCIGNIGYAINLMRGREIARAEAYDL